METLTLLLWVVPFLTQPPGPRSDFLAGDLSPPGLWALTSQALEPPFPRAFEPSHPSWIPLSLQMKGRTRPAMRMRMTNGKTESPPPPILCLVSWQPLLPDLSSRLPGAQVPLLPHHPLQYCYLWRAPTLALVRTLCIQNLSVFLTQGSLNKIKQLSFHFSKSQFLYIPRGNLGSFSPNSLLFIYPISFL